MRKAVLLSLLILCSAAAVLRAQTFYGWTEYGLSFGGAQYFGDLNDQYGFNTVRPVLGGFVRFHLNPYIAVRLSATGTQVGYDDVYNKVGYQRQRNLRFKSDVFEGALQAEFNFFRFSTGEERSRFTPYLTGGIGAFYYNPYAMFNDRKYFLRELGTEGQNAGFNNRSYGRVAMCFPVGAGVKWWVRPGLNLGFEIADRITTTDYLDDVSTTYVGADLFPNDPVTPNPAAFLQDPSVQLGEPLGRGGKQRGNSASKDQYLYFILNLSLQLKVYRCPTYLKEGYLY